MQIQDADAKCSIASLKCRRIRFGSWTGESLKVDADADVKLGGLVVKERARKWWREPVVASRERRVGLGSNGWLVFFFGWGGGAVKKNSLVFLGCAVWSGSERLQSTNRCDFAKRGKRRLDGLRREGRMLFYYVGMPKLDFAVTVLLAACARSYARAVLTPDSQLTAFTFHPQARARVAKCQARREDDTTASELRNWMTHSDNNGKLIG
ncbi:hypothetical protein EDB81DRAFT_151910 [Dactylonectria macrodidyma]|uniref:Uncharacterized protein n=1 Tax=Dactylonectria macrodidyma TaxID=307937 RepID=A0A9P9JKR0_9HYPO|nr:hypothetical protein EDB81DRAFT_151910 [Dactylonectria macrodidyma]